MRVWLATLAVALAAAVPALLPASGAAFKATTSNPVDRWSVQTCGSAVVADNPFEYYKLAEASGTTAADSSGNNRNGVYQGGGFTYNQTGPCGKAVRFNGSSSYVSTGASQSSPQTYTIEIWFKTTTTSGGRLIGFDTNQTGASGQFDRHLWMLNNGRISYGVYNGGTVILTTTAAYNDGAWHHAVGTQSSAGMRLYVDGVLRDTDTNTTAEAHVGYWRIGGTTLDAGWTGNPSSPYFQGTLAEAAIYTTALSATRISAHYAAGS